MIEQFGIKFRVTHKSSAMEKSWVGWNEDMDATVGQVGTLKRYEPKDRTYLLVFPNGESWWYTSDCLELA